MVTRPDVSNPPTTYNVTLEDSLGVDLLNGLLPNRSITVSETTWIYRASAASDRHATVAIAKLPRLKIANAGNGNQGVLAVYALRAKLDEQQAGERTSRTAHPTAPPPAPLPLP